MALRRMSKRRRLAPAVALATFAHLLAVLALGWRIPTVRPLPLLEGALPPMELLLLRRAPRPAPPTAAPAPAKSTAPVRPSPAGPEAAQSLAPPPNPLDQPSPPTVAEGPLDCDIEDLPLLTEAERVRCRNQIDAEKERQMTRGADERAARKVAEAQHMAPMFRMDADKQASYDAVVQARTQQGSGPPPLVPRRFINVTCSHLTFPLLSGVEINPNHIPYKYRDRRPHNSATCTAQ